MDCVKLCFKTDATEHSENCKSIEHRVQRHFVCQIYSCSSQSHHMGKVFFHAGHFIHPGFCLPFFHLSFLWLDFMITFTISTPPCHLSYAQSWVRITVLVSFIAISSFLLNLPCILFLTFTFSLSFLSRHFLFFISLSPLCWLAPSLPSSLYALP